MSILVGKHIKSVLSRLERKVKGGIYLEGLNREADFPYMIFSYTVQPDEGTKDGGTYNCNVNINIYSLDGDSSIELAEEVRKEMEDSDYVYDDFIILSSEFVSYRGALDGDVYTRELEFNIKTY